MGRGTRVRGLTTEQIRARVTDLRSALGYEEPYFPIAEFLDVGLPRIVPEFTLRVVEDDVLGEQEGVTVPDELTIILPERVYMGALAGNGRDRFTCAHELGHLVLHRSMTLARVPESGTLIYRRPLHPNTEDSEWQADTYAAEFLMPVEAVREFAKTGNRLARECGVSLKAAMNRLMNLRRERLIK